MNKKNNNIIRKERNFIIDSYDWKSNGISLSKLTPFQYRFEKDGNGIDYYITSGKYFHLNSQKWGNVAIGDIPTLLSLKQKYDVDTPRTSNVSEQKIIDKYTKLGYNCLKRGYPDFCFYNDNEIFFIEVKNSGEKLSPNEGLNKYQVKMIDIFKRLGLNVSVEYL